MSACGFVFALEVGWGSNHCVWSSFLVFGNIYTCVYLLGCWRPKSDGVCSPHGSLTREQVAVAKSFSRHLLLICFSLCVSKLFGRFVSMGIEPRYRSRLTFPPVAQLDYLMGSGSWLPHPIHLGEGLLVLLLHSRCGGECSTPSLNATSLYPNLFDVLGLPVLQILVTLHRTICAV